jgi:hypothetical protein
MTLFFPLRRVTVDDEVVRLWKEAIKVPYKAPSHSLYKGTVRNNGERHSKFRKSGIHGGVGTRKLSNVRRGLYSLSRKFAICVVHTY